MLQPGVTESHRNASNHCHFFPRTANDSTTIMKDFCKGWDVHITLKNGLFVHWSKYSFKAVKQHNGNINLLTLLYRVHMKDTYENLVLLSKTMSYSKYGRKICGEIKVIGLLLGMQSGYTKFCCVLCEWDSRAKDKHYKIKHWPMRENSVPGEIDR